MTINELDQGIRNLIATQPEITNTHREVINGINQLIDAYRNLSFRIQTYQGQDILKFGLLNEAAKFEITLTNLAYQVLQERGINLLLYIPRANGFGMGQLGINVGVMDASSMIGQMPFMSGNFSNPANMPKVNLEGYTSQDINTRKNQENFVNELSAKPIENYVKEKSDIANQEKPLQQAVMADEPDEIKPRKPMTKPVIEEKKTEQVIEKNENIKARSRDYLMNLLKK